ncbi:dienelactone hydrolase family protein [Mycetocola sp.]|uniref:dienelactone hydrolase family protein n=1 Tax=Mycetocola sp. TaxID=1871042 RepID=UPI003989F248
MTEIVLFHHAQGLTPGVRDFADALRNAGHRVHLPDLYDGRTFDDLDAGIDHARSLGFDTVLESGRAAADELPSEVVYGGFSLGAMPAQLLAQTQKGARGALLFHACLPVTEFGDSWPRGVPVQIHAMDADPEFVESGDIDEARVLVDEADDAELFLYPGDQHLFTDNSLSAYDEQATTLLLERVLVFLSRVG